MGFYKGVKFRSGKRRSRANTVFFFFLFFSFLWLVGWLFFGGGYCQQRNEGMSCIDKPDHEKAVLILERVPDVSLV